MIFVSDHARSSKWWCTGAISSTRRRNILNEITWIATESASITKIPPMMISRSSVWVITAKAPIAPPRPSEPVSPMKIEAGNALNHKKPIEAPTKQPARSARSDWPLVIVIAM